MRGLMIWCLTVGLAHAREGCPELVSTATLSRHISEADMAFSTMDESTFRTARWTAQRAIPCLGEPIQAGQAAAYYRMEALGSFVDQHHAQTVGFFKSMLRVAPHYLLPEAMAPDGHPLRVNFEVAQGSMPLEGAPVQRAGDGVIRIDGRTGTEFPKDRPYLFQHVSDSGIVLVSTVVGIGVEPPRYGTMRGLQNANAGRGQTVTKKVQRSPSPIRVNVPLASIAGGAAAVAGITYALAVSTESKFWDPTTKKADLKGLKKQTNTMVWMSGVLGTVALGTGVSAFLVGEF